MIVLKRITKFLSIILTLILVFSPLTVISADAVTYPDGVTEASAAGVIPKLNALLKALLSANTGNGNIKDTVYKTLFSDDTLNSLFSGIYTALGENASSLSVVGINISPASISKALGNYTDISKKIASCSDMNAVIKASKNFKWGVTSKESFEKAVSAMLSPFNALLNALLCSGRVDINALISIQGDDGYTNAIVPLLNALDCPKIMSSSEFSAAAAQNQQNIIRNILDMVFLSVDKLLDDPVIGMCSTLPKLAFYLNSGKLSASLTTLLEPLSLKIAGFLTIPGLSDLISSVANIEESVNIDEMLEGLDMSSLLGSDVNLQMPEIDLSKLSECVTDNGGTLTVNQGAAFVTVMDMLIEIMKLNKNSLGTLMGSDTDLSSTLDPLLSKSNGEIIKTIITLFSITSAPANNYQWNYPGVNTTPVTYTPTLTATDYVGFIEKVDPLLTDFVKETDPEGTIEDTLRKTIYSNNLVSTLVTGIFSMMGSEETAPLFALLGIDASPAGIGNAISQYYPSAANQLYKYSSWDKVNPDYLSWGFYDGDEEGFKKAVTRVLSPFTPLLTCILAGQNVTLLDAITIPGSDGYNTAIIPLLEALGCKSENIKTYEEYKQGAGTSNIISDILTPICALLDEVCASPVKTICRILPNIIYFFNSGLMNSVLDNLLYPVKYMLDSAGLGEFLTANLPETSIDLNSMINELTSGTDLGIKLPELDVAVFGTLGTASFYTSKRVSNGAFSQYTYLTADEPGVFLTLLRYLVGAISMEENSGLLTGLMASEDTSSSENGMPDMFAMYAENITEKFKGMTTDEIIEWLCDLLFSESPIVELPVENEEIPTIIYKEKFELSTTQKLIIVLAVVALMALAYYILSMTGKLDNLKLQYRKQKEVQRRKKESKKLIKGGGIAVQQLEDAPKEKKPKVHSVKMPVNAEKLKITVKEEKPLTEKDIQRQEKRDKANDFKAQKIARKKLPDEKEAEKLLKRQQQAAKRAAKNELKIQKQYAKAKQQAAKKNSK
ncbi:MAG: hypothetical protein IKL10_01350 [Clostridia bacterium]|nr:hypothetical protein [Clostridia bacterium]